MHVSVLKDLHISQKYLCGHPAYAVPHSHTKTCEQTYNDSPQPLRVNIKLTHEACSRGTQKSIERAYAKLPEPCNASSSSKKPSTPGHMGSSKAPPSCFLQAVSATKLATGQKTPSSKTPAKSALKSPCTPNAGPKEREASILSSAKRNRKKTERLSPTVRPRLLPAIHPCPRVSPPHAVNVCALVCFVNVGVCMYARMCIHTHTHTHTTQWSEDETYSDTGAEENTAKRKRELAIEQTISEEVRLTTSNISSECLNLSCLTDVFLCKACFMHAVTDSL
jgi:hypothetical protein